MSFHEAFISVINEQPELFSTEDREDLAQQDWSDDVDELGDQIYEWASTRENIYDAALERLSGKESEKSFSFENRLPGKGTKAPEIKPEDYKPMLLNAIHRSFTPQPATAATKSR